MPGGDIDRDSRDRLGGNCARSGAPLSRPKSVTGAGVADRSTAVGPETERRPVGGEGNAASAYTFGAVMTVPTSPGRAQRRAIVTIGGLALTLAAAVVSGCGAGGPAQTPIPTAGRPDSPREVNVIAKDYVFVPDPIDVLPGETVLIHFVNGGLVPHELVIGDAAVQEAWERAWAATVGGPPGTTPAPPPPEVRGLRVYAASGQRVDVLWTVPDDPAAIAGTRFGCHLPGHWQQGMRASLRIVSPAG